MLRPFTAYAALRSEEPATWSAAAWGALRWLLLVACFVSWTTSGRLVADHIVLSPLAWGFGPILQAIWILIAIRLASRGSAVLPARQVIALYFRGHGPWMLLLLAVSAICLFVPEPSSLWISGLVFPALGALMLVALTWGAVLTYALFSAACGLDRWWSGVGTVVFYVGYGMSLLAHFAVTGQLAPILGWVS
jgi:hypothetical protein